VLRLAIAGDLHGQWDALDAELMQRLAPDALLVVGDLADGDVRLPRRLRELTLPVACVLGNHDAAKDASGRTLSLMEQALGPLHCGWSLRLLEPPGLAVVGGRPGSPGGGFHLSAAVKAHWGDLSIFESAERIAAAALQAPPELPLVLLAHSGPSGLGSAANDPCGRDWKRPACDWGDQDLQEAIVRIRRHRAVPLVVFGHMHHRLRHGAGERRSLHQDRQGTVYLNAACVPRHLDDADGAPLRHFSWVEMDSDGTVSLAAQRWYRADGAIERDDLLLCSPALPC
jgi:uncharacterized protein (TIGR04168 family)|tara:strand:- start:2125 stop:2979 length:855 start_codon:yes stop_codon:yes gene_type:complete